MNYAKILYRCRNWRAHWRALWIGSWTVLDGAVARLFGQGERILLRGELGARVLRADGSALDLGCIAKRVVTNAGVTYMRDDFNDAAGDINAFNFHDSGTGAVAEAVGDTALGTPAGPARVAGTKSTPAGNQYRTVATIAYTATLAITEHGLFSASTAGTLWDRSVFAAINVVNGESIQFTYTLTINAGG